MATTTFTDYQTPIVASWLNDVNAATYEGAGVYTPAGTGAVATTVQTKLREHKNAVNDYGADPTGVANSTTALLNFFNACIDSGVPGHIPAGDYLVTAGVLVFDNGFTDKAWPDITTDGYDRVTFSRADATNAPLLTLSNGTASSGVGNYWNGGSLGGITFDQNGKATASSQHGLSLTGVYSTKFGWMRANDMGGSCVYSPQALYGGSNPDPYAVTFCKFEAIEANRCLRYALENQNWVGLNGCSIGILRVIECVLGGFYGLGAGNHVEITSMGSVGGTAFHDGTATAATGGAPSRFSLGVAELDDVENGFYFNRTTRVIAKQVRFVARYNFSSLNPSGGYWPRTGINIGAGVSPAATDIDMYAIWRIEAGGTEPALGTFINFNSYAGNGFVIDNRVLDNAGFGIDNQALYSNVSLSSATLVLRNSNVIFDSRVKPKVIVRSATSVTVPNSGYGAAGSKITFATALSDTGSNYDTANSWFVVPFTGDYRVTGRISLAIAAGTLVRLGFATDTAGVVSTALNKYNYSVTANAESYEINGTVRLTYGNRLFLMAQQGTGGAVNLSAPIGATADLTWSVEAV